MTIEAINDCSLNNYLIWIISRNHVEYYMKNSNDFARSNEKTVLARINSLPENVIYKLVLFLYTLNRSAIIAYYNKTNFRKILL